MSKYEIAKISVTNPAEYERAESFNTAKDLFSAIRYFQENENGWFYGNGSNILRNGKIIATLRDYEYAFAAETDSFTGRVVTPTPSISRLIQYVSDNS